MNIDKAKQELIAEILPLADWLRDKTGVNVLENITADLHGNGVAIPRQQIDLLTVSGLVWLCFQLQVAVGQHVAVERA